MQILRQAFFETLQKASLSEASGSESVYRKLSHLLSSHATRQVTVFIQLKKRLIESEHSMMRHFSSQAAFSVL